MAAASTRARWVAVAALLLPLLHGCAEGSDQPAGPAFPALRTTSGEQRLVLTGHVVGSDGVREIWKGKLLSWDASDRHFILHVHGWDGAGEPPAVVRVHTPESVPGSSHWGVGGGGRPMTIAVSRSADGKYRAISGEPRPHEARSRTIVFDGEVVAVADAPGFWSGTMAAFQVVTYRVVKVVKGAPEGARISISHLILHAKGDWRIDEKIAGLNPKEFAPGKVLRITATYQGTDKGKRTTFTGLWLPDSVERVK